MQKTIIVLKIFNDHHKKISEGTFVEKIRPQNGAIFHEEESV